MRLNFFSHWRGPLFAAFICPGAGLRSYPNVQAQTNSQPSAQPALRIETGTHTAGIKSISAYLKAYHLKEGTNELPGGESAAANTVNNNYRSIVSARHGQGASDDGT